MKNILNEEFQIHDTLNPAIWNGFELRPEVEERLFEVVELFKQQLAIPLNIADIQLCGSNASYNYTEFSDLDLHIIANYETQDATDEILQALYNSEKTRFNKDYDITVHGVEIELYVQDIRSSVTSNGIYSLTQKMWVKKPKPITGFIEYDITVEVDRWTQAINQAIEEQSWDKVNKLLNNIYLMRHNSIARDGEFGKGNQIFKEIRNIGLLDEMKTSLKSITSKQLSLEGLSLGHLVNRLQNE